MFYINRKTGERIREKVAWELVLKTLYAKNWSLSLLSIIALPVLTKIPALSKYYGARQKRKNSKKKIYPFITEFKIDHSEFEKPIKEFSTFNEFFIRKLKSHARPIDNRENVATFPADGRYTTIPKLNTSTALNIKGKQFNLKTLLNGMGVYKSYESGSAIVGRLALADCHRYHFPCDCTPKDPLQIAGPLFSVHPIALKNRSWILSTNKRTITILETELFSTILYIEVGATFVGSIKQTFTPHKKYFKGDEKGYFEFGGSTVILLFQPGAISFDNDLVSTKYEIYAKMGTSMGKAAHKY